MDYIVSALRLNPELAIFLTVAIGFLIGRVRFGSFSLGIVVGCLLAGVLVGQLDIKVSPLVKTVFFDLFLFTTGYKVGPQFFRGLKSDALPQMALTVVLCVTCLLVAFGFSKLLGYDVGTAAGLLAGAFSESTVIGTAGDAIQRLTIPEADKAALINNIPVAYAVTYLVGTAALVWFIPTIGPKLMGVNLRDEGARMRGHADGDSQAGGGVMSAARTFDLRAYRVANPHWIGRTIAEIEALPKGVRAFVLRVRSGERILEATRDLVIQENDVVAVAARHEVHAASGDVVGPEVSDLALLDIPVEAVDVVVTNRLVAGKTLGALAEASFARGIFLSRVTRSGIELPVSVETRIDRGDVMHLVAPVPQLALAAEALGYADRRTSATDMVFVGTGDLSRRARRPPVGGRLGRSPDVDGERRRAGHGPRVRMAALRLSTLRPHPRAGDLDLRHARPVHVHRHRRLDCGTKLHLGPADDGPQPRCGRSRLRPSPAHGGNTLRPLRAQDGAAHRARRVRRRGHDHGGAASRAG